MANIKEVKYSVMMAWIHYYILGIIRAVSIHIYTLVSSEHLSPKGSVANCNGAFLDAFPSRPAASPDHRHGACAGGDGSDVPARVVPQVRGTMLRPRRVQDHVPQPGIRNRRLRRAWSHLPLHEKLLIDPSIHVFE